MNQNDVRRLLDAIYLKSRDYSFLENYFIIREVCLFTPVSTLFEMRIKFKCSSKLLRYIFDLVLKNFIFEASVNFVFCVPLRQEQHSTLTQTVQLTHSKLKPIPCS